MSIGRVSVYCVQKTFSVDQLTSTGEFPFFPLYIKLMLYFKLLFLFCYGIYFISQKVISKKTCLLFYLILKEEGTSDLLQLNNENRQIRKIYWIFFWCGIIVFYCLFFTVYCFYIICYLILLFLV